MKVLPPIAVSDETYRLLVELAELETPQPGCECAAGELLTLVARRILEVETRPALDIKRWLQGLPRRVA